MTAFTWQDEYSVGDEAIDAQHRKLIDILNRLHDILNRDTAADASADVGVVFDQLAEYVMTHFAEEERRMAESSYPLERLTAHKRQHDALLARVQEVMTAYQEGNTAVLIDLLPYLYGDWLIDHICHVDKDYSGFL